MAKPAKFRVDVSQFAPQPVQFGNDFVDFDNHRTDNAQVPRTVLAQPMDLVPDGF